VSVVTGSQGRIVYGVSTGVVGGSFSEGGSLAHQNMNVSEIERTQREAALKKIKERDEAKRQKQELLEK